MQSVLRLHRTDDISHGLDSKVVCFFEETGQDSVIGLALSGRNTPCTLRDRFQSEVHRLQPEVGVYLNFWGLPLVADLDTPVERRIAVLHSDWPGLDPWLTAQEGLIDGVITISSPLKQRVLGRLKSMDEHRVNHLPCPISPPEDFGSRPLSTKDPDGIRIGMIGRVSREQKRIDRIPEFCRQMDLLKEPFQLEILGDGPEIGLVHKWETQDPRIHVLGRLDGDLYWNRLKTWDVILFLSDFEGIPLALLEALSAGVLPVYPDIDGGGKPYLEKVSDRLLYPKGRVDAAARVCSHLAKLSQNEKQTLVSAGKKVVEPHLGDHYLKSFSDFVREIRAKERISARHFRPRPFYWTDHLPFGFLRRYAIGGLLKSNPIY